MSEVQSPETGGTSPFKRRRFNDKRVRDMLRSYHTRRISPLPSFTQPTVITDSPSALPRLRPTPNSLHLPKYHKTLQKVTKIGAILGGLCLVLALLEGEVTYRNEYEESAIADVCRGLNIVLGLLQTVCTWKAYSARLEIRKAEGLVDPGCKLHTASLREDKSLWSGFLLEIGVLVLLMPPGVYVNLEKGDLDSWAGGVAVSELVFAVTCLRTYQFSQVLYWRFCGNRDAFHFPFKYRFKRFLLSPFLTLLFAQSATIFLCGAIIRSFERAYGPTSPIQSVYSGFWLTAQTYTTMGYGEVPPRGGFSRLTSCLVAIAGVFTNTVVVTSLLRSAKLKPMEQLFAVKLHDLASRRKFLLISVVLIQRWWRFIVARREPEAEKAKIQRILYQQKLKMHTRANTLRTRPTQDLAELLDHYAFLLDAKFQETSQSLEPLPVLSKKLSRLCTKLFTFTSSILLLKRKAMNLRAILITANRRTTRVRSEGRRGTIVSKTQQKKATDQAFVRMLERGTSTRLTLLVSVPPIV